MDNQQYYRNNEYQPTQNTKYQQQYMQQPTQNTNYQQQYEYQQQNIYKQPKQRKVKKKKKHRFLKFIIFVVLCIIAYKQTIHIFDMLAEHDMQSFVVDYPFEFAENNSVYYITDNFIVPTSYIIEDKEYKVEWTSDLNALVHIDNNGVVTVTRPDSESRKVTLTQTYKKLLGKATRQYELNIISNSTIKETDVDIITLDELKDNTYNREMTAVLNKDGTLDYMIGDFKNTKAYSAEDAIVILQAYKEQFGITYDADFEYNSIIDTTSFIDYMFNVYCNGYKIDEAVANVTIDKDTYKVKKIEINAPIEPINIDETSVKLDYESIITNYINNNDIDNANCERICAEVDNLIYNEKLVKVFDVYFDNCKCNRIYIDANSGEVVKYFSDENTSYYNGTPAVITGTTELGDEVELVGSSKGLYYTMHDQTRRIHTYDNNGWWGLMKKAQQLDEDDSSFGALFLSIGGLIDYGISNNLNAEICSFSKEFDNSVAVQSQYYISLAYDWYKNIFNLTSYDGKASPIVVITDVKLANDNAQWDGLSSVFKINPAKKLKYSVSSAPDILCHEYTHAVFGSKLLCDGSSGELKGMNEAYADVFACLITQSSDWVIGKNILEGNNICFRDLYNINRTEEQSKECGIYRGTVYPTTYKGENWTGEEHDISVVLSNVAARMKFDGGFTENEIAHIWYDSLGYGYNQDSTYLTARSYIVNAAKENGISEDRIKIIETYFADRGIGEYPEGVEPVTEVTEKENSIKTLSKAIDGDAILDDTVEGTYLMIWSPVGTWLGQSDVLVYQQNNGASATDIEVINKRLSNVTLTNIGGYDIEVENISVEYRQVPKPVMDILVEFCDKSENYLIQLTYQGMGADKDSDETISNIVKVIVDLGFRWEVKESTAYEFYNDLGIN